jgi:hypothetical protein
MDLRESKRPIVKPPLEILEDRTCPSGAPLGVPALPSGGATNETSSGHVSTWKPVGVNELYSNPANWDDGFGDHFVPGTNGMAPTALFNANVSDAQIDIDVDPSSVSGVSGPITFELENGYDAAMSLNASTITLGGYTDYYDTGKNVLNMNDQGTTTMTFGGTSAFGNVNSYGDPLNVVFPADANAAMGWNTGFSVYWGNAGFEIAGGTLWVGNDYDEGLVQTRTGGNVVVNGPPSPPPGASPDITIGNPGQLYIEGDVNGQASTILNMAANSSIVVGSQGQGVITFVNNDATNQVQTLDDVAIDVYSNGTIMANGGGNWSLTGKDPNGNTIQLEGSSGGTMNVGKGVEFALTNNFAMSTTASVLNVNGDGCYFDCGMYLLAGTLNFNGFYALYTTNANIGGGLGGASFTINAEISPVQDGSNGYEDANSLLEAFGNITLTGSCYLYVTGVGGGQPPSGYYWDLMFAAGQISGDFADVYTNVSGLTERWHGDPYNYWECYMP